MASRYSLIVLVLIVVGVVLYLINNYVPMASPIKTILNLVVVVVVLFWVLRAFGLISGGPHVPLTD